MPDSRHTLLRQVKQAARKASRRQDIRAIGVDDWAWNKGKSFGTIVVDLERRTAIDVLPTRSAKTLSDWLRQHPGVSVVARDRQGVYAEGTRRGAPDAMQVADRFHLIQNLREAVERALAVQRPYLRLPAPAPTVVVPPSLPVKGGHRIVVRSRVAQMEMEMARQRRQEKLELFETFKKMQHAGLPVSEIARHLGVNRRRLNKWARLDCCLSGTACSRGQGWRSHSAIIYGSGGNKGVAMAGHCWRKSGNWDTSGAMRS